ncbi:NADH-quinone oxidoreductase subunit C [Streptomyces sp. R-07]|uniref:NADH-quinone oxidoreductase subunit C n=1 Tax=Streptomyces sp. R-07 TaxID=3404052 RepID=UPI003CF6146F
MTAYDSLPDAVTEIFGEEATAEQAYDLLTVDVPPASWLAALTTARDELGCTYFDWLSAVDEPGTGFRVCAHVVSLGGGRPRRLLLRTTVPHDAPVLPTAIEVYAGAGWHERETHEMFGVDFAGHPHLVPLLLPENFEGHPLRKDFVLAARVAKAWPGAKEPGESHDGGGPKRRQMLPPGVPDPNEWGPLKGQLPPAPARPARATAGDRPVRRTRTVTEGSASQTPEESGAATPRRTRTTTEGSASQATPESGAVTPEQGAPTEAQASTDAQTSTARPPRRSRSAADGSASQAAQEPDSTPAAPPRRSRSAADGSASQSAPEPGAPTDAQASTEAQASTARPPRRSRSAADGSASQSAPEPDAPAADGQSAPDTDGPAPRAAAATPRTRSSDAPWHHARPAFDEEPPTPAEPPTTEAAAQKPTPAPEPEAPEPRTGTEPEAPEPRTGTEPEAPEPRTGTEPEAPAPATRPPGPEAPAPAAPAEDTSSDPEAPEAPAPRNARAADRDPAGHDGGTDSPTDPAGGDPA